jgi:DNA polymerase I-like protein with 3'-5' exonuclease and polymerase domains
VSSLLENVDLHFVDGIDEAWAMARWAGERREVPLAFDTESSGLSPERDQLRLIQIGDTQAGWAVPMEWSGAALEILRKYDGELVAHNLPHDFRFLFRQTGLELPWHKLHDTLLLASLDDPMRQRGLKPLAKQLVDPLADSGQRALDDGMKKQGWDWGTVPVDFGPYVWYSALDPVLTAHLWKQLYPRVRESCPRAYDAEMGANRICTRMMLKGLRIDRTYVTEAMQKLRTYADEARAWLILAYDITSLLSARQIAKALTANGEPPTGFTPTGLPQVNKEFLLRVKDYGSTQAAREIAEQVLGARHAEKLISAYLENFLTQADCDDVVHCQIWQAQAVTGRMCIPDSHRLLTQRGVISVDEIRAGDRTIDSSGNWTTVREVHRYRNAETVVYSNKYMTLEATREHRWVLSREGVPDSIQVEPMTGARRTIHLAPGSREFDFRSREIPLNGSREVQFAALIGWLVSDGRSVEEGNELRSYVYQTERKFYKECLRSIPGEALMYDRITDGKDHHEMRISTRWLRPRLEAAGLSANPLLRTSGTLMQWVMSLSLTELRAFFAAVWLADGNTSHPASRHISCSSQSLREVLQYAGYRLGYRSHITKDGPGGWSNGERYGVKFAGSLISTRYLRQAPGCSDVWCITTDSGTFTAWDQGPYLTGNSVTSPALQTLSRDDRYIRGSFVPRDDHVFISCDYDQVEARLCAHYAEDEGLIRAFANADAGGPDFFAGIASQIFGREITKKDQERQLTKNVVYGACYGAGVEKMAQTAGVPVATMRPVKEAFDRNYPGVKRFSYKAIAMARSADELDGRPAVRSGLGRYLPVERGKEYVSVNRIIQAEAAEVLKLAMLDLEAAGLGPSMCLPIHDEILFEIPKDEAEDARHLIEETMTVRDRYRVPLTCGAQVLPERWQKG